MKKNKTRKKSTKPNIFQPTKGGESTSEDRKKTASSRRRLQPNWPLFALSGLGMLLSGYLSISTWMKAALPYCGADSACDVVQGSQWGLLWGQPVAFWGFLTCAGLAWIAFRVRGLKKHWVLSFSLALVGAGYSTYLSFIAWVMLDAACIYCLGFFLLMWALVLTTLWQRPATGPAAIPLWPSLGQSLSVALVMVGAIHFGVYHQFSSAEENPYLRELASHLSQSGAEFYGAFWCGYCEKQKAMFKASAHRLPYIECSPNGRNGSLSPICAVKGVKQFPTWFIEGQKSERLYPLEDLARLSDFTPTQTARAAKP